MCDYKEKCFIYVLYIIYMLNGRLIRLEARNVFSLVADAGTQRPVEFQWKFNIVAGNRNSLESGRFRTRALGALKVAILFRFVPPVR